MIQINDGDSPITAAQKIIHGIKIEPMTPARRIGIIMATGKAPENGQEYEVDMFTIEEIREIVDYLQTYLKYHEVDDV